MTGKPGNSYLGLNILTLALTFHPGLTQVLTIQNLLLRNMEIREEWSEVVHKPARPLLFKFGNLDLIPGIYVKVAK